ncbi:MAG: hypothetical protein HW377_621 [Actinobacteria bacterium]|nr:hypothetical protein [Actinomycetota bacterium]
MLQVQLGKAIDLFAGWGVRQKDLSRFLETGVVKASLSGRGKGSLRLLDERSVYDVYLAHTFHELGLSPRRIAKIVENVRPHYSAWITGKQKWLILRFRPTRGEVMAPATIRIDLSQPLLLLRHCESEKEEVAPIRRGRPRRGRIRRPIRAQFTRRKGRDGRCHHHGEVSATATSWTRASS